jgi:hypothetical protein
VQLADNTFVTGDLVAFLGLASLLWFCVLHILRRRAAEIPSLQAQLSPPKDGILADDAHMNNTNINLVLMHCVIVHNINIVPAV